MRVYHVIEQMAGNLLLTHQWTFFSRQDWLIFDLALVMEEIRALKDFFQEKAFPFAIVGYVSGSASILSLKR